MHDDIGLAGKVLEVVRHLVAEIADVDVRELNETTALFGEEPGASLGLDSLDGLEISMALEDRFGLEMREDVDFTLFTTIGSVVEYVLENRAAR